MFKLNFLIIPMVTVFVLLLGRSLTSGDMIWYQNINLPSFTPPGFVIAIVWQIIFILTTIAAIIVYNIIPSFYVRWFFMSLFLINAILNVTWSYLFFYKHWIGFAVLDAGFLGVSVIILMFVIRPYSSIASLLLLPYFLWVSFATYLNYQIWILNNFR